jgi:hypothetical protein
MRIRTSFCGSVIAGTLLLAGSSFVLAGCGDAEKKSDDSVAISAVAAEDTGSVSGSGSGSVSGSVSGPDGSGSANGSDGAEVLEGADGANGSDGSDGSSAFSDEDAGAVSTVADAVGGSSNPIQLTGNGVDGSRFGDKFETVMAAMAAAHGAFDDDSMWEDQQSPCEGLGTKERRVQWGSVVLVFSNGPTEFGSAGVEHLISVYSEDAASPTPANAPDGKALLDETVGGLKTRFPDVEIYTSEITGPSYSIKTEGEGKIGGILSGLTDKDSIVSFNAGLICID